MVLEKDREGENDLVIQFLSANASINVEESIKGYIQIVCYKCVIYSSQPLLSSDYKAWQQCWHLDLLLSLLNIFTAATPDLCASSPLPTFTLQTALDKGSTHAVETRAGSKAEDTGHIVVTSGIIRHLSVKSVNDEGGDVKIPTVVRGSCE